MDDLPELPFEKVLSYLSLQDRLKARAVSRRWYHKINSFKVQTLCYSDWPRDFIHGKDRWVSGAFAKNFISSRRFESFFKAFGRSVLSRLKHLRLCELRLDLESRTAFSRTLKSFGQLEELNIIRVYCSQNRTFKLTLPMLTSIHLEKLSGFKKLTLDASRLRKVKILDCPDLRLDLFHDESVEELLVDRLECTKVKNLKNLKCLYTSCYSSIDPTLLSSLEQLNEVHTMHPIEALGLFELKERPDNLKIYLFGLSLNDLNDPAISSFEVLLRSAGNRSRLADEIPLCRWFLSSSINCFASGMEINFLKRFVDLVEIRANQPVQDVQRFLDLLKNLENVVQLHFQCAQPQDLFDRLPEHSAVQELIIDAAPSDHQFLFRLKHLFFLHLNYSLDIECIRNALEQLPFLTRFSFRLNNKYAALEIPRPKQFRVFVDKYWTNFPDLNSAIQFLVDSAPPQNKRKAEHLE